MAAHQKISPVRAGRKRRPPITWPYFLVKGSSSVTCSASLIFLAKKIPPVNKYHGISYLFSLWGDFHLIYTYSLIQNIQHIKFTLFHKFGQVMISYKKCLFTHSESMGEICMNIRVRVLHFSYFYFFYFHDPISATIICSSDLICQI